MTASYRRRQKISVTSMPPAPPDPRAPMTATPAACARLPRAALSLPSALTRLLAGRSRKVPVTEPAGVGNRPRSGNALAAPAGRTEIFTLSPRRRHLNSDYEWSDGGKRRRRSARRAVPRRTASPPARAAVAALVPGVRTPATPGPAMLAGAAPVVLAAGYAYGLGEERRGPGSGPRQAILAAAARTTKGSLNDYHLSRNCPGAPSAGARGCGRQPAVPRAGRGPQHRRRGSVRRDRRVPCRGRRHWCPRPGIRRGNGSVPALGQECAGRHRPAWPGIGRPRGVAVRVPPPRRPPGAAVPDPGRGVAAELDLRAAGDRPAVGAAGGGGASGRLVGHGVRLPGRRAEPGPGAGAHRKGTARDPQACTRSAAGRRPGSSRRPR